MFPLKSFPRNPCDDTNNARYRGWRRTQTGPAYKAGAIIDATKRDLRACNERTAINGFLVLQVLQRLHESRGWLRAAISIDSRPEDRPIAFRVLRLYM